MPPHPGKQTTATFKIPRWHFSEITGRRWEGTLSRSLLPGSKAELMLDVQGVKEEHARRRGRSANSSRDKSHPAEPEAAPPARAGLPDPFPSPGHPGAVRTAQAVAASPASSATCTSYSRQCGGTRPPGGLQATRSSWAGDSDTSSCSGAEGWAGNTERQAQETCSDSS